MKDMELLKLDGGKRRLLRISNEEWEFYRELVEVFKNLSSGLKNLEKYKNSKIELTKEIGGETKVFVVDDDFFQTLYSEMDKTLVANDGVTRFITWQCYYYLDLAFEGAAILLKRLNCKIENTHTNTVIYPSDFENYAKTVRTSKPIKLSIDK